MTGHESQDSPKFDREFWRGVTQQAEYLQCIFTTGERAEWEDPELAADEVIALREGDYINREQQHLIGSEGS